MKNILEVLRFKGRPKNKPEQKVSPQKKESYPPPWGNRNDCIRWWANLSTEDKHLLESVLAVENHIRKQDYNLYRRIRQCHNPGLTLKCRGYEVIFSGDQAPTSKVN